MRQLEPACARAPLGAHEVATLELLDRADRYPDRLMLARNDSAARADRRDECLLEPIAELGFADRSAGRDGGNRLFLVARENFGDIAVCRDVLVTDLDHVGR